MFLVNQILVCFHEMDMNTFMTLKGKKSTIEHPISVAYLKLENFSLWLHEQPYRCP